MRKKERETIIKELWEFFYDFDNSGYYHYTARLGSKAQDPDIKRTMQRIESAPAWGKTKAEHKRWAEKREKEQSERYDVEMFDDALRGRHYKHAIVMYDGSIRYHSDYREICRKAGIRLE